MKEARQDLYRRMDGQNLAPLWEIIHNLLPHTPATYAKTGYWNYEALRPFLLEAGQLITAQEAIRRVLMLENPGMRGQATITQSLYAGLQLIMPGEVAPPHRHSQSALRFAVEGLGAFTAVNGERAEMRPGDFLITPSGAWHDHGNPGNEPVVWLDGLDVQLVKLLGAQFHEIPTPGQSLEPPRRLPRGAYSNNLVPLGFESPYGKTSPIFCYPYNRSRESLDSFARSTDPDECLGWKMKYTNPLTGGYAMPTIAAFLQYLPKGFRSNPYRSTDGTVYSVIEGHGKVGLGDLWQTFGPRDLFVIPSWFRVRFEADEDCVLFSYSDRAAQEALGLWRESRS